MAILNNGRTGLGGGAVGGMKSLIKLASAQAKERKQFGQPIAEFGLVREKIAQMTVDCFAAESAVWMVAHLIDAGGGDYSVEAAMSKVFASEAVQDRKSVVKGKSVSVRVDLGGRRNIKKKNKNIDNANEK